VDVGGLIGTARTRQGAYAIRALNWLRRDPTRIIVPELTAKGGNSLTVERLARLLAVVRERHPEHFAYVATRASDGDAGVSCVGASVARHRRGAGVIRVILKQVEGVVGEVTRKKQAL
jgi:hypothetical protein